MVLTVAWGLLGACWGGLPRPRPAAGGTLTLPGEHEPHEQPTGPLKVAFSSPSGAVGIVTEVNVVFDRPVRPLGVLKEEPAPFRLTPEIAGSFRWVGSRAAVFTPLRRLPLATEFSVEVPAGIAALDGTSLLESHRFQFETRRPSLQSSTPSDGERGLPLDTAVRLEFDQVVTPDALRGALELEVARSGERSAVAFDVVHDRRQPRALIVRPTRPLAPQSAVTFTVAASLRGVEGGLEAGVARSATFYTYEPLALQEVSCARVRDAGPCEADASVALQFNNAVRPRSLAGRLRVTPDVGLKVQGEDGGADRATTYVELQGSFQAGQSYRLQLAPGVADEFGQSLLKPATAVFRFADHRPRVEIGAVGRNFAVQSLAVPVASRNVSEYELFTAALSAQDLLAWRDAQRSGSGRKPDIDWLSGLKGVGVTRVRTAGTSNQIERRLVDARQLLGPSGRGALAIGARYGADPQDWNVPEAVKVLNLSELGMTAKVSRFGSLVWVTERGSNGPVAGAEVVLVVPGRPERSFVTDADGLVRIPAADFSVNVEDESPEARAILLARRGQDSVFAPVSEYIQGYRLDPATDFSGTLRPYGVLFSDRGIYRPGDQIHLKGIVRSQVPNGNALLPEQSLKVTLRSPSGEEVATESVMLTSHGTLASKLGLPSAAQLGTYQVAVSAGASEPFLQESLEVAEYRPAELRVEASAERSAYTRGDTAQLEVKAEYLFGAAASGLEATLSVSRARTWYQVPGSEEFSVNADAYYSDLPETSPLGELRRESRKLDERGRVAWTEKLDLPGQRGVELLRIDTEVTDLSRRSVASSKSALVHPAAFYVGLKLARDGFVDAPGSVTPELVALQPDGRRAVGKRVVLELVERRYSYAREPSGEDYRAVSRPIDRVVARCEVVTAAQTVACPLAVPASGYYLILARAKDDRGNGAESAVSVYATGPGEPTWQDSDRRGLTLILDKKSYAVGERARVLVKSPYKEAEALITLERSGVYRSFRRVLHGTAPSFEVAVTDDLAPNVFVGVHLLPRRSGRATPLEPGSYRIGYANLQVDAAARRLSVRIAPNKSNFRPGEDVGVALTVRDARGGVVPRAEVTLYAADEGVLSLINYRTPDPWLTFSGARALQVATVESRDAEGRIQLEALGGRDKGRDGGGGGDGETRRDFRQTAYFNPRIITDERGEAKVGFKLPDGLTTYRLMAVAVTTDDRYGFAEERVTTSKPLMARPALPRFVRAGDSFEAGLVVSKKGMPGGKVKVVASVTGLAATGALAREVEVPENASLEVSFPLSAPRPGQASVRFEVSSAGERDLVAQPLPIALPMSAEVAASYGQTTAAQTERLGELRAARDDVGGLSIALSSTALVGIDQTALELIEYPYGCTEQLSSRILPLVALGDLTRALGFSLPADARKRAEVAVGEVLARQQGDGGFAMWPESETSTEWVSAYAALALSRAARAGVYVPKTALGRARDYLRATVESSLERPGQLPTAALAVDVLGELGTPDAGSVNRLFARRKELPLFGKALLLHAAIGAKLGSDVPAELRRDLEAALHVNGDRALVVEDASDGYRSPFDSKNRTQALVLRALAAQGPHPLLTGLARGLIGSRKQGKFRTTQEGAWALLALDDYRRVAEPESPRFEASVGLGGESLGRGTFNLASPRVQRFELPLDQLKKQGGAALLLEKRGAGTLFYEARLRYAPRELPKAALDAGFFVEKSLHSVDSRGARSGLGAPSGVASAVAGGDLVLVDLTVVTPAPREYVVLDDPLPAGLEAVDPRLATTADWLKFSGFSADADCAGCDHEPAVDAGAGFGSPSARSEVRDDRVLFFVDHLDAGLSHYRYLARATTRGHFLLPPTRVEEMYQPEVFGRTAARELTVR